jgi:hypothetical protein
MARPERGALFSRLQLFGSKLLLLVMVSVLQTHVALKLLIDEEL